MSATGKPNAARMRKIKARLIERDGAACFYCRTPFVDADAVTVDHLVPRSALPGWRMANLVPACRACNEAKADRLPQDLLRPSGYGPGLVPVASGSGALGATGTRLEPAHLALAGAA